MREREIVRGKYRGRERTGYKWSIGRSRESKIDSTISGGNDTKRHNWKVL